MRIRTQALSDPARLAILAWIASAATGCTPTWVIGPQVPPDGAPGGSGIAVQVARVTDRREFLPFDNAKPWIPSHDGSARASANPALVISRLRGPSGGPRTSVFLEPGRDVVTLTREMLTAGFRQGGYRVLAEGDPGGGSALPVQADIVRFWVGQRPGFWAFSFESETRIRLQADVDPFREGDEVCGYIMLRSSNAVGRSFNNTLERGIQDFVANLRDRLSRAKQPGDRSAFVDERCLEGEDHPE